MLTLQTTARRSFGSLKVKRKYSPGASAAAARESPRHERGVSVGGHGTNTHMSALRTLVHAAPPGAGYPPLKL